jgi:glycosyltransferase involved in cell wall biosynthesis
MPSTFPEAFGMVAAEAAACGVPPVSADHSGMREVTRQLSDAIGEPHSGLLSFEVREGAVEGLAASMEGWLGLEPAERRRAGAELAARVRDLWSWDSVAEGVIAASAGELDRLPRVAAG